VPFTSFCEYADTKPRKTPTWFAGDPIHPNAMPVILTTPEEVDLWLTAPAVEALQLQRPVPDVVLRIVATGERQDTAPEMPA
jgi:putative SOS response-associated peptidase YedK